ncbi:MAG: RecQ family ATP-dependent DNA helicase [Bacteroidales bacterium]|nr:RecQ family ATP-dependent DNA helicase [Bacteroidales bacterium]
MNLYQQILVKYWGYSEFRPMQDEIIKSVVAGHDALGLLPTGGGKSITYQVPALAKEGLCLVITPLIALMMDQVANLNQRGIRALAIHSGLSRYEIDVTLENAIYGDYKFLYVSPERLTTEIFRVRLEKMNIILVAVDEAHCISQWGYDFRPSYLNIASLRKELPDVPFLALTATATPDVVDDIQDKLLFKTKNVFKASYERKNLNYTIRESEDKNRYLLKLVQKLPGTGIIYVRSRKKAHELALFLNKNKISCDYYHAGLTHPVRTRKQYEWMTGRTRVVVATNAFGMGIDKPDVRFVIHFDLPSSLEEYFQEAGRAGRDNKPANAILLYNEADKSGTARRIIVNFPELDIIKNIYRALGNYFQIPVGGGKSQVFDFNIAEFASRYSFSIVTIYNSLKILQMEGYLELTEEIYNPSKVKFLSGRDDLYRFQVANADFDAFIKLLLRTYSGIFTEFVTVYEDSLAGKAGVKSAVIADYLKRLDNMGIIRYLPQKKTPVLIYTEERLDIKDLRISKEVYRDRKDRFVRRVNQVLDYAAGHTKCRSVYLLEYFGEKNANRCGQCDVCLRRNELDLSKYEFDLILEEIKDLLKYDKLPIGKLVDSIPLSEKKTIRVIRWLLDNNKIIEENNLLCWNIVGDR